VKREKLSKSVFQYLFCGISEVIGKLIHQPFQNEVVIFIEFSDTYLLA
jgi:hypothetical protein